MMPEETSLRPFEIVVSEELLRLGKIREEVYNKFNLENKLILRFSSKKNAEGFGREFLKNYSSKYDIEAAKEFCKFIKLRELKKEAWLVIPMEQKEKMDSYMVEKGIYFEIKED